MSTRTFHPLHRRSSPARVLCARVAWLIAMSVAAALALVVWAPAEAADADARAAEGPYFHVASDDPTLDALPLEATRVEVRIDGVIAEVRLTQHYRNRGQRPIEARYVFPGSTQAAVHAMQVRLGERVLDAVIREKQRARLEYDAARRQGRTGALLEQERPNVFSMNVANILPGDEVQVELRYTELVARDEGHYRFVLPTVVGPRYHRPAQADATGGFPATAHLPQGVASDTRFELQVQVAAPLPVRELRSPSHALEVTGEGTTRVQVALAGDAPRNDRDFILEYRLAGERTASGLMLHRDAAGGENYFVALVEPPQTVAPAQISPRDYIFVVDVSGSMRGYPLDTAKLLLRRLIGQLRPSDSFNLMLFSGSSRMLADASVPATRANIERALDTLERSSGGGGTELVPALRRVAALPKPADVARTVVVVTDGYVTVENEVFRLVRRHLGSFNLFAFGIGSSVNRHLIEGLARAGHGEPFIVTRPEQAAAQAERLRRMIEAPVLTQLRVRFEGLDVYDVEPAGLDALPDVLGARPVLIHGKWRGEPQGQLVIEGQAAGGAHAEVVPVGTPDAQALTLRHLWARSRIRQLSDQEALEGGSAQRDAITRLGLEHSLLTQYTSFVAVDQVVRTSEVARRVDQPLPLPQGVESSAVAGDAAGHGAAGVAVPSTPEPTAWLALLVVLGFVGTALVRRRVA